MNEYQTFVYYNKTCQISVNLRQRNHAILSVGWCQNSTIWYVSLLLKSGWHDFFITQENVHVKENLRSFSLFYKSQNEIRHSGERHSEIC